MGKDSPLRVEVEGDELVIRIGIGTLAFAQHFRQWYTGEVGYAVTDEAEFAKDVKNAMQHEEEDGSSPINDFLDKMCDAAVEDGSVAASPAELRWQVWKDGKPFRKGRLYKSDAKAWDVAGPIGGDVKAVLIAGDEVEPFQVVLEGT